MELFQPNNLSMPQPTFVPMSDASLLTEVRNVLASYAVPTDDIQVSRFAGDCVISQNYRLEWPGHRLFLKSREGDSEERRLRAEAEMARRLLSRGVPVPKTIPTREGEFLVRQGEKRWVAYEFVEGHYFQGDKDQLRLAAEAFGRLTLAANEGIDKPKMAPEELRFLDSLESLLSMKEIEALMDPAARRLITEFRSPVLEHLRRTGKMRAQIEASTAWVHTDYHPLNLLMESGRVSCILDMEDVKVYPLLAALGFASYKLIRQMWTKPELRRELGKPQTLVDQWIAGWRRIFPSSNLSFEELSSGACYRVLALIHFILLNASKGRNEFNFDLEKQIMSLFEIDVLFRPAAILEPTI